MTQADHMKPFDVEKWGTDEARKLADELYVLANGHTRSYFVDLAAPKISNVRKVDATPQAIPDVTHDWWTAHPCKKYSEDTGRKQWEVRDIWARVVCDKLSQQDAEHIAEAHNNYRKSVSPSTATSGEDVR